MGCDGGSICDDRRVIVNQKEEDKKPSKEFISNIGWSTCALSGETLKHPIVADQMGILYNKIALLEAIQSKTLDKERFSHIKNLKSVFNVSFTTNPDYLSNPEKPHFICPSTNREIAGAFNFYLLKKCGHVFHEKVFEEIDDKECTLCGVTYDKTKDILLLNPSPEKIEELRKTIKPSKRKREEKVGPSKVSKVETIVDKKDTKLPSNSDDKVYSSIFIKDEDRKIRKNDYMTRGGMKSASEY
eukprot:gene5008-8606_t